MRWLDSNVAFALFLLAVVAGRLLGNRALAQLTAEEKARLLDAFARQRVFTILVLAVILGAYVLASKARPEVAGTLAAAFFGALILYIVVFGIITHRRIQSLQLPAGYVRGFVASQVVQYAGVALLFGVLIAGK